MQIINLNKKQNFIKYFNNTSWLLLEKLIKLPIGFFAIVLLTRYLGPKNFGVLSYSQSFVSIFMGFSTLGLDVILVRELTMAKRKANVLLGTAFYLKSAASLISLLILIAIVSFWNDYDSSTPIIKIIAISLIFQNFKIIDTYFQAKVISKHTVNANIISFIISSLTKIVFIFYKAPLVYFAFLVIFDHFVIAISYIYIFSKQKQSIRKWKFESSMARYLLSHAWPLILVTISALIYTKIDQIMIKHIMGSKSVGNYAAAVRISEMFVFIPILITQSIFPKIIEMKNVSQQRYLKLLAVLYSTVVWTSIPIALGLAYFSKQITSFLYGSQYKQSGIILILLAPSIIFTSIGAVSTKILYAEHFEKKYLYRTLLGMITNIALNFILITKIGAVGAAIATVITLFIIHYIYDLLDKELYPFYYLKFICFTTNPLLFLLEGLHEKTDKKIH